MLYGFTVTKAGTDSIPISKITSMDYNRVWDRFSTFNIIVIYKFMHHGNNHIHFHGLVKADHIDYKKVMVDGYSIKFEKDVNYEKWHNYCMHEINEDKKKVKEQLDENKGRRLYLEVMNRAPRGYVKPNILLRLKIFGSI